jgi:hypothetical protein
MLYYILVCTGTCLNVLLYISKHSFVIFPARRVKNLNLIEFMEIPNYVKFDVRKVPRNATLNESRGVAGLRVIGHGNRAEGPVVNSVCGN